MKIPSISHHDKNIQTFLLLDMNYGCYKLNTKSTLILISKFFTQIKPWASWHGVYILMWVYILIYSLYYDLGFISDMTFVLTALWEIYKTRKHVAQTTSINIIVCWLSAWVYLPRPPLYTFRTQDFELNIQSKPQSV